jgi:uncharacterized repeat protein (TIGR01451 family)
MKGFSKFWLSALLGLGLMLAGARTEAQGFGISITNSATVIGVSNSLTYTINVTNLTAGTFVAFVTNTFPATAQLLGASITPGSATTTTVTNANGFSFNNILLNPVDTVPFIQTMTVMAEPTQIGFFTNTVVVAIFSVTNITVYMVTQVTNATVLQADLAVGMTAPASAVFTNDWMVYGVSVTNLGPNTVPNVMLTNTLPAGVGFISVSPSNHSYTVSTNGSNVIFNLGTLTNQAFRNFQLTVQPTNAGSLTFVSVVNTNNNVIDPNPANNSASANITVGTFIYDQLIATNNSGMSLNRQTGLMEQTVRLTNIGTNAVAAARVIVSGLTNRLYNAVGTNSGNPYVVYNATLDTNQFVDLVMEYFVPGRQPINVDNTNYTAVGVPFTDLSVTGGTNGFFLITTNYFLPNHTFLIEFQSMPGSNYTFTTTRAAQPSIVAPANRTQWIDEGPPKTVSNSPSRLYRVRLNP